MTFKSLTLTLVLAFSPMTAFADGSGGGTNIDIGLGQSTKVDAAATAKIGDIISTSISAQQCTTSVAALGFGLAWSKKKCEDWGIWRDTYDRGAATKGELRAVASHLTGITFDHVKVSKKVEAGPVYSVDSKPIDLQKVVRGLDPEMQKLYLSCQVLSVGSGKGKVSFRHPDC